jgi:hypothetical protein
LASADALLPALTLEANPDRRRKFRVPAQAPFL